MNKSQSQINFNQYFQVIIGLLLFIFLISFSIVPKVVLAQTTNTAQSDVIFNPQITIPGSQFQAKTNVPITNLSIADYIIAFYKWAIRGIAVLAVFIMMLAGFKWLTSAGNTSAISRAKTQMMDAIIGILLILFANVMLYMINPALVRFKSLNIPKVQSVDLNINISSRSCEGSSYSATSYDSPEDGCKSSCGSKENIEDFYQTSPDRYPDSWCCICKGCPANSEPLPNEYKLNQKNCSDYCADKNMQGGYYSSNYPECCRCTPLMATKESCEGVSSPHSQADCTSYGGECVWGGIVGKSCVCRYYNNSCHWHLSLSSKCATETWSQSRGGRLVSCNSSDACMNGNQPKDCQNIGTKMCVELDSSPFEYAARGYDGGCCAELYGNQETGEYKCIY